MWTSADEYCERKMLEAKENNIEEVRKERDSLKEHCEKLQKQIEEMQHVLDKVSYQKVNNTFGTPWEVVKYKNAIQDELNHIANPRVYK